MQFNTQKYINTLNATPIMKEELEIYCEVGNFDTDVDDLQETGLSFIEACLTALKNEEEFYKREGL